LCTGKEQDVTYHEKKLKFPSLVQIGNWFREEKQHSLSSPIENCILMQIHKPGTRETI